jgi:hypothetical protein
VSFVVSAEASAVSVDPPTSSLAPLQAAAMTPATPISAINTCARLRASGGTFEADGLMRIGRTSWASTAFPSRDDVR